MTKVCHLTSVHRRYDIRIFYKECISLSKEGFDVNLIVADGLPDEIIDGIKIFSVSKENSGRLKRFTKTVRKVYRKAKEINADLYHIHDPELLLIARRLKNHGHSVIFDSHEDVPQQILSKTYIPIQIRRLISTLIAKLEKKIVNKLDAVVAATPTIRDKFLKINKNTVDVNNYPIIDNHLPIPDWNTKERSICYVGGITVNRGIKELIVSLNYVDVKLNLAGNYQPEKLRDELKHLKGWEKVEDYGFVDRIEIQNILNKSMVGMVTLHPIINYLESLPIKMFEYMLAGLPVICSNFPLWQEIVEGNGCGKSVDPADPKAISQAINFLLNSPQVALEMGQKGRKLILEEFNWGIESKKLIVLYLKVLKKVQLKAQFEF